MKNKGFVIIVLLIAVSLIGYKVYSSQRELADGDFMQVLAAYQASGKPTLVFFGTEVT